MSQQQIEKITNHQVVINTSQNPMSYIDKMSSEVVPNVSTESVGTSTATDHNTSVYIMAGAAAGIMEHCLMYPVDSIKVNYKYNYSTLRFY